MEVAEEEKEGVAWGRRRRGWQRRWQEEERVGVACSPRGGGVARERTEGRRGGVARRPTAAADSYHKAIDSVPGVYSATHSHSLHPRSVRIQP